MPSLEYFKKTTREFILKNAEVSDKEVPNVLKNIDWFVEKTGGWETHYGIMFEGICGGFSFEEQLQASVEIYKTIKFKFGG